MNDNISALNALQWVQRNQPDMYKSFVWAWVRVAVLLSSVVALFMFFNTFNVLLIGGFLGGLALLVNGLVIALIWLKGYAGLGHDLFIAPVTYR